MLYLSCLDLDTRSPEVRRWYANPYLLHQSLLHAWQDGGSGRMLYRPELDRHQPRILVQSPAEADWSRCFPNLAVLAQPARQKSIEPLLQEGQALRFFLRANPTARRVPEAERAAAKEAPVSGIRVGLLREEEQEEWLRRKGEANGFHVLGVEVRDRGDQVSFKKGARLVHRCVEFEGHLRVTDPTLLCEALEQGIGTAKGFGFGLLSLAPG